MNTVIFGVTGQDGAYLARYLLDLNCHVLGVQRRSSVDTTERLKALGVVNHPLFELCEGDVTDPSSIQAVLLSKHIDECYNLSAQSHVGTSFNQPTLTWNVNAQGCINILEVIRRSTPDTRFYQASTSEMFGNNYSEKCISGDCPSSRLEEGKDINGWYLYERCQNETTPFAPTSPYAVAKLAAHNAVETYRRAYGLYACAGILFNHESELRGENFVTRKISRFVAKLKLRWMETDETPVALNEADMLPLGNLNACRDWGHAEDYVEAMWCMLQLKNPKDYVIATGKTHSVMDFLKAAFRSVDLPDDEDYIMKFVRVDPQFVRPSEVNYLRGDASLAREDFKWTPKVSFEQLVERMVSYDILHTEM
jgi:GDPmannose 4,6-dehydratase